ATHLQICDALAEVSGIKWLSARYPSIPRPSQSAPQVSFSRCSGGWCHRRGCRMSAYGQTYTPQPEHSLSLKLASLLRHHVIFTPTPSPVFTLVPTHFLFFSLG
ncbi:hypothetical protein PO909_007851, partial [Leuciscus waleckii]